MASLGFSVLEGDVGPVMLALNEEIRISMLCFCNVLDEAEMVRRRGLWGCVSVSSPNLRAYQQT